MPSINRRGLRRRPDIIELDDEQRRHLLYGFVLFSGSGFMDDREAFEEAWEMHGEQLFAEFIAKYPGHRPFAWWLDHGEERPVINRGHPRFPVDPERLRRENRPLHFGYLHTKLWANGWVQEPEPNYLDRMNLLTPAERRELGNIPPADTKEYP